MFADEYYGYYYDSCDEYNVNNESSEDSSGPGFGSDSETEDFRCACGAVHMKNRVDSSESEEKKGVKTLKELILDEDYGPNNLPILHYLVIKGSVEDVWTAIQVGAKKQVNYRKKIGETDLWHSEMITPLYLAVSNNEPDKVKVLLEHGADVNFNYEKDSLNILHIVAQKGLNDIADVLLDRSNINILNPRGYAPIAYAAENGQIEMVLKLISKGAGIDQVYPSLPPIWQIKNPLHCAVRRGHIDVVALLLNKGAKVDVRDDNNDTPLCSATFHYGITALLLDYGSDIEGRGKYGYGPLHRATSGSNFGVVDLLIRRGADIEAETDDGWTPLFTAMDSVECLKVAKVLLRNSADVNKVDAFGCTPLHYAVQKDRPELVHLLLFYGANPNARDRANLSPLHYAAESGSTRSMLELISKGGDVNGRDGSMRTSLHIAAIKGHIDTVALLLNKGAKVDARDTSNCAPLHSVVGKEMFPGPVRITDDPHLLARGSRLARGSIKSSYTHNHKGVISLLLDFGANINAWNKKENTPLHLAVSTQAPASIIELLIHRGADETLCNGDGKTPVCLATSHEIKDLLKKTAGCKTCLPRQFKIQENLRQRATFLKRLKKLPKQYKKKKVFPKQYKRHSSSSDGGNSS